jgi:hypothetical protein
VADLSRKLMRYLWAYAKIVQPSRWSYRDPKHRIHTNLITGDSPLGGANAHTIWGSEASTFQYGERSCDSDYRRASGQDEYEWHGADDDRRRGCADSRGPILLIVWRRKCMQTCGTSGVLAESPSAYNTANAAWLGNDEFVDCCRGFSACRVT